MPPKARKGRAQHQPTGPRKTAQTTPKPLTYIPEPAPAPYVRPLPSASRIRRFRTPALIVLGGITLYISFTITNVYTNYKRQAAHLLEHGHNVPADTSFRFNQIANQYDYDINWSEDLSLISRRRKQLLAKARGHVLEASVGTGRNASFYPLTKGIKSITMVDQSQEMVRVARMNWAKTNAWFINAMFRIQSAADPIPLPHDAKDQAGFDTVVQTMGVCSTPDPVAVLRNLGRLTRPEGKILLLEHGRAKYEWLNSILDTLAPAHAEHWGCWWNKDVGAIVRESKLEIVEERRYNFGTTWWLVLKPPQDRSLLLDAPKAGQKTVVADEIVPKTKPTRPWWAAWW